MPADLFEGRSALVERELGQGHLLYLGWYPSLRQVKALLAHLSQRSGIERLAEIPVGMVALRRGKYTLLFNFCDQPLIAEVGGVQVDVPARDFRII